MNAPSFSVDQLKSNAKSTTLAFAGIYVAAFDTANKFSGDIAAKSKSANTDFGKKIEDLNASGVKFFDELVSRGEKVEADAKSAISDISLPKVELPELSDIKLPKSLSDIELPEALQFDLPKFEVPKAVSELKLPKAVSELKLPKAVADIKLPEAVSDVVEKVKSKVSFSK